MKKSVFVFFAEGSEELEALAVVDILRRSGLETPIVSITSNKLVSGAHGIKVEADLLIEEADFSNALMLILPGGLPGAFNLAKHSLLNEVILNHYNAGKKLAAICAAPLVYGRLGLLKGVKSTCYPGFENHLEGAIYTAALVEKDGQFITGKGPAAAFEFGYAIVTDILGSECAMSVRSGMLYDEICS